MSSKNSQDAAAEFREYARGTLDVDHQTVHPWAGEIEDPLVRQFMAFAAEAYDPEYAADEYDDDEEVPTNFEDTDVAQEIRRKYGTETATEAFHRRDKTQLSFFSGLVNYDSDASGMGVISELMKMIKKEPVLILYIWGAMGNGKTDFALLLIQVFEAVYSEDSVKVASNIQSFERGDQYIDNYRDWQNWLEEGEVDDDYERILIIDEAAQALSGVGSDAQNSAEVGKKLKLARKYSGHVIFIGQDGKDVGPAIRSLTSYCVHKTAEKEATFYLDVKNRRGVEERLSLSEIPPTDYEYKTGDISSWGMLGEEEEYDEYMSEQEAEEWLEEEIEDYERELMGWLGWQSDLTRAEIAEHFDVSEKTVTRNKKRFEDEYAPDDRDEEPDEESVE
ncbi:ATP-binding protein [Halolamina salifodinae]|uniref:Uncharacterized protein n=1 Tax=Halolamina salifodinae TaxID=1202767 RepID=A0A8T4GVF5_9EURY|nr:ATP-binding protein [Halolamina salifodinae]MBP1986997.1 hypothetical protein [Halolamina salifodinae]